MIKQLCLEDRDPALMEAKSETDVVRSMALAINMEGVRGDLKAILPAARYDVMFDVCERAPW